MRYTSGGVVPDGMLVRVSNIDADTVSAYELHSQFIHQMSSAMPAAVDPHYQIKILVPGSHFHGIHGLTFDKQDQLYAGSVVGQSIYRVDTKTGEVKVLNLVNGHDIGKAIHPPSVEGQLEGGAQQGLGFVLTEEYVYDDKGRVLNNDFTDYKMLGPSDMPNAKIILIESAPDPIGPMGAKSCGESALMGPIGSVANAIHDAIGIMITEAPITPEKVLAAIKKHGIK